MRLDFHGKRGKFKFKSKTYRSERRYSSPMALKFPVQYRQSKSCSIICHATCSSRREVKACYMCFPSSDSKGESLDRPVSKLEEAQNPSRHVCYDSNSRETVKGWLVTVIPMRQLMPRHAV